MLEYNKVINDSYRRIYFVWGLVVLFGFLITSTGFQYGWLHWYPLSLIGIFSQIYHQSLKDWKAKAILILWAATALGGTFVSHQLMVGTIPFPVYFTSFAIMWLWTMGFAQAITGIFLKSKYQILLGIFWIILSIIFKNFLTLDESTMSIITALVTGLPYLYIAFKK